MEGGSGPGNKRSGPLQNLALRPWETEVFESHSRFEGNIFSLLLSSEAHHPKFSFSWTMLVNISSLNHVHVTQIISMYLPLNMCPSLV